MLSQIPSWLLSTNFGQVEGQFVVAVAGALTGATIGAVAAETLAGVLAASSENAETDKPMISIKAVAMTSIVAFFFMTFPFKIEWFYS
jgi:hypothetical protein